MVDKPLSEVELDDTRYQVVKMAVGDAISVWAKLTAPGLKILGEDLQALNPGGEENVKGIGLNMLSVIPTILASLNEEDLNVIRGKALYVCRMFKGEGVYPVYDRVKDRMLFDLEPPVVLGLMIASVSANLAPFFSEKGLSILVRSFPTLKSPNPET